MTRPTKILGPDSDGEYKVAQFDDTDRIENSNLPAAVPSVWETGTSYFAGQQVFFGNVLYLCIRNHTSGGSEAGPNTGINNLNWAIVGPGLQRIATANGTNNQTLGQTYRSLEFLVDQDSSYTSPSWAFSGSAPGTQDGGRVTLRLPEYASAATSGITAVNSDATLQGDGNTDPLGVSASIRHSSVLISGQLVSDSPTVTNTPSGYSTPLEYSWESATYIRIFADSGVDERLYLGTDLSTGLVYTKTY